MDAGAWAPLVPLAATGMAYGLATVLHGSGLIAAFTAGLAFGAIASAEEEKAAEMIETVGDGFSAATFLVFGAAIVPMMLDGMGWGPLLFAVLALTVVRMVPVALALLGTGRAPSDGRVRRVVRSARPGVDRVRRPDPAGGADPEPAPDPGDDQPDRHPLRVRARRERPAAHRALRRLGRAITRARRSRQPAVDA